MKSWYLGSLAMLFGAISYGVSGPVAKLAFNAGLEVRELVPSMFFVSSILFWMILLFVPYRFQGLTFKKIIHLSMLGAIGLGGTVSLYYIAIHQMPVSIAIVLLFQFAWITLLIDWVRNLRRPNFYEVLSLSMILIGTVLAVNLSSEMFQGNSIWGYLSGFIAAFCYSVLLYFNSEVATNVSALTRSAIMSTGGLFIVLIVYPPLFLFNGGLLELGYWPLLSGILNQVFPTVLMAFGIPFIGGALPGLLGAVELPASIFTSFFMLGESITVSQWLGIILILMGSFMSTIVKSKKLGSDRQIKNLEYLGQRQRFK